MGSQKVGHDWATNAHTHTHTHTQDQLKAKSQNPYLKEVSSDTYFTVTSLKCNWFGLNTRGEI